MGIASKLEDVLRAQIKCHVAWLPISNSFALGDYGIMSGGVFTKMGHVSEFGGKFTTEDGPDVKLDFVSASTTVTNFVGETAVQVIPQGALNAKVVFKFNDADSIVLKANTVQVKAIADLNQLMKSLRKRDEWEKRFHVVRQVWIAQDATVLCARDTETETTFTGDVPALKELSLGKANASLSVSSTRELGLKLVGKTGAIGLGFAKFSFFGDVKTLGDDGTVEIVDNEKPLADDL